PEVHHVAVLDDVVFSFDAQGALRARRRFAAVTEQLVPADHLRLDEATLEIGVDRARRLWRPGSSLDDPGAALVLADREVALQTEQVEAGAHELVQAGLGKADVGEELRALFGRELLDLGLDLAADGNPARGPPWLPRRAFPAPWRPSRGARASFRASPGP